MNLKALVCENDPKWAVCIDAPCKIDPDDPTKVTCKCPIANSTPWLTFGGDCDQVACKQLWSAGQTMDDKLAKILAEFGRLGVAGADYPMCNDQ